MKTGKSVALALLLGAVVFWIKHGSDENRIKQELNTYRVISGTPAAALAVTKAPAFVAAAAKSDPGLQAKYDSAIKNLSEEINKSGLDGRELNRKASEFENQEDFIKDLPPALASAYRQLNGVIGELQDVALKAEGKDRSVFKKAKIEKPEWVAKREEQLNAVVLSAPVQKFVQARAEADSISDEDVHQVIELCGQEKTCIEKSAYLWIRANHRLSGAQFKILGGYL